MLFEPDQEVDIITTGKTGGYGCPMLMQALDQVEVTPIYSVPWRPLASKYTVG